MPASEPTRPLPDPPVRALAWEGDWRQGHLALLDQTRLPGEEVWQERTAAADVIADIRRLAVRGAPAIGVAAAFGLVLAARECLDAAPGASDDDFLACLRAAADRMAKARPTAVNLGAAVVRLMGRVDATGAAKEAVPALLLEEARTLETYEREACDAIGRAGADWLRGRSRILTHCNAGALVTPGLGTALAPLYVLHAEREPLHVWVDETRPLLQGLRLTAYELGKAGIDHQVLVEGAASGLMRRGEVDAVIVGADRICRNGDVVNKVGTYGLAVAARHHGVPFLVAAPLTTIDPDTSDGDAVE
ncbi:MAG: S-methyl-5-thioribose-1-phosphate isomerase, partial [Planctomycetota bacterium]